MGFAGQAFQTEVKGLLHEGDTIRVNDYMLRCQRVTNGETPNYIYQRIDLAVVKNGRALGTLRPERRFFPASQQPTSIVAIKTMLAEDLYAVLGGPDPESGKAIVEIFVNPLVIWVWIGGVVIFLGTLLALVPSRVEREMAEIRRPREEAVAEKYAL